MRRRQQSGYESDVGARGRCKPRSPCRHQTFALVRSRPVQRSRAGALQCCGAGGRTTYRRDVRSKIHPADATPEAVHEVSANHGSETSSGAPHDLVQAVPSSRIFQIKLRSVKSCAFSQAPKNAHLFRSPKNQSLHLRVASVPTCISLVPKGRTGPFQPHWISVRRALCGPSRRH